MPGINLVDVRFKSTGNDALGVVTQNPKTFDVQRNGSWSNSVKTSV